jgi:potassium-transporting ATPase KdpC subunit
MLRRQLLTGLLTTICLLALLGGVYPLAVWAVGRVAFRHQTDGSFVSAHGRVVGSSLIGQRFIDRAGNPLPQYFQPRPSSAGAGYDPTSSGGSQLGPSNPDLLKTATGRVTAYRRFNGLALDTAVPVDAVTASGSGLDPDISLANALDQSPRVAEVRHMQLVDVVAIVRHHTTGRAWGILGEKTVNVLDLNLALDRRGQQG